MKRKETIYVANLLLHVIIFVIGTLLSVWNLAYQPEMGLKLTKQGSPPKISSPASLQLHERMIHYLTKNFIRNLVSKQRRRILIAGYDLDMSYITDRVLAMSFPAERMRAMYRNPLWQVKSVLDMRHLEHYKVCKFESTSM